MLKDRDPHEPRKQHVHCTSCRDKMLPSMCGAHYCMGCKVAVSTRFSVAGPMFLNALVGPTYVRGAA
jgi:hypothetical protein